MSALYAKIGDANQESAFLTNEGGYDVAVLSRVLHESVPSDHQSLTDDQWQQVIDLIDAAPDLLAVLQQIVEDTNKYIESGDSDSFKDWMRANCEDAERAIAKAKGGAL